MFIAAVFITAETKQNWKQAKCPSIGEWINKLWSGHSTEYQLATERDKLLDKMQQLE